MPLSKKATDLDIIVDFVPQPIEEARRHAVSTFVESQVEDPEFSFEIDSVVSEQIGLTDSKKIDVKNKFDAQVLSHVEKIKTEAYDEAFKKGLADGVSKAKEGALAEARDSISEKLLVLTEVISELNSQKEKMYRDEQKEITALCYHMTEILVAKTIERDESVIIGIINTLLLRQKNMDNLTVHLSVKDLKFLEEHVGDLAPKINTENIKFEEDADLQSGDILIKNSRGTLDGRIESRLENLKSLLGEI